jgi:hypothetical protein
MSQVGAPWSKLQSKFDISTEPAARENEGGLAITYCFHGDTIFFHTECQLVRHLGIRLGGRKDSLKSFVICRLDLVE